MPSVSFPAGVTEQSFDAAFLAAQPKAVQAFMQNPARTIQDALALAGAGYLIDLVTMYWGWSAGQQTIRRMNLGYTWVPAINGPQVTIAPGLTMAGFTPYDPTIIPIGGIALTLDPNLLPHIYAPLPGSAAAQAVKEGN